MSHEILGLVLLALLFIVILSGFPISFTLFFLGMAFGYIGLGDRVFYLMTYQTFGTMMDTVLAAVAMFTFMGYVLESAGLMKRLFHAVQLLFGRDARLALSRDHLHRDAVRGRDRHRRRLGDHHRADGGAGDAQVALRHGALRRHDLRRRHARHPHPAERDAGGDGAGAAGVGRAALCRRAAARPAAREPLRRLHDGARLAQSEARTAAVRRRAQRQQGLCGARVLPRADAAGGADHRDARLDRHRLGDADRRRGDRLRRRAARDRRARQAHLADAQGLRRSAPCRPPAW